MRIQLIELSFEVLEGWMKGISQMDECVTNLPEDAHIVRIQPHIYESNPINKVQFIMESKEWNEVSEGSVIPTFLLEATNTYDPYAHWDPEDV